MKRIFTGSLLFILLSITIGSRAQSTDSVKLLFIYGSKPAKGAQDEQHWRGGLLGGHVGLEIGKDSVLNFSPHDYHSIIIFKKRILLGRIFPIPFARNSNFFYSTENDTWYTFPGTEAPSDNKRREIVIPITPAQKKILIALADRYTKKTPYDYAFLGMRCASATWSVMAKAGIVKSYGAFTWLAIFRPGAIRKRMMKMADDKGWPNILLSPGKPERIWEQDK